MLASLELFGFKSFAERTSFDFDPGVTAVVGPNGSGKSNVVDAIKWVLGDQSAKSLRGKEMTDVIFNGATGRKPSNFSEATLTFDNKSGFLPTTDPSVRVGRRLWRNGDSEYLLNDQVVRLKDVRDLFMGTGAGTSAYAIIEQGRVDQILQANAIGRRAVFEEAAGISRYKTKKTEALRRLERVEQNLLRLTDIVDEVEAQLHATRTQAAKAAAHRDISRELERWWLGMAADDFRHATAELATLKTTLAEKQAELDTCQAEQAELDEQVSGLDAALSLADSQLREAERHAATTREAIAGHDATQRFQSDRLNELTQELTRLRRQVTHLSQRASEGQLEQLHNSRVLESTQKEITERQELLENRRQEVEQLANTLETLAGTLAATRADQTAQADGIAETERRIAALVAEYDGLRASIENIDERLGRVLSELDEADRVAADEQSLVDEAEAVVRVRQGRATDLRTARERLAQEREACAARVASLRERKSATAARIAVLEDLQNRGEGFGIGVREILRRARSLMDAPWNQIHGTVADLLDVDLDDAPLLEIALGDRAQLVVIENFDSLIPYLGHSSAKIAGRVGFLSNQGLPGSIGDDLAGVRYIEAYPHSRLTRQATPWDDPSDQPAPAYSAQPEPRSLHGLPGVLKRADELIRPSSRMPHLATRLLRDTWVVSDLAIALRLAAGHGRGQRFVTQSGELLDCDGTLVVGTLRAESAVVSRRSELIRLRSELLSHDRAIEEILAEQSSLDDSQHTLASSLTTADADLREAIDALNRARAARAEANGRCQRLVEQRQQLELDRQTRLDASNEVEHRLLDSQTTRTSLRATIDELRALQQEIQHQIDEATRRRAACDAELAAERLELVKGEERLASLQNAVGRMEKESQQRAAQRQEANRRLETALAKQAEVVCHLLNTKAEIAACFLERDQLDDQVRAATAARDELKGRRGRFNKREATLSSQRRSLGDAIHQADLAIRERTLHLDTLGERIQEEFNLELAELADSVHSAIPLWIEERQGSLQPPADAGNSPTEPINAGSANIGSANAEAASVESANAESANVVASAASFSLPPYMEIRPEIEARVERLRKKLRMMGAVNTDSLADLEELETRHGRLSEQLQDLVEAKRTLEDLIRRINSESKRMFLETFESIRGHFQDLFRKLFGGGEGDIVLEDEKDVLDCGIDIVARPPGKELRSLSLLSGGEKTMTCVGLLLAIFKSKPSPFCLLDEVDAALDEANIGRFVGVLKEFKSTTQFIMITHRKPSMCEADVLYGVTMEQAGVSKRLNVRFDDIAEDGNFKSAPARKAA